MKQQLRKVLVGRTYTTQTHCFPVPACLHALHEDGKTPTTAHCWKVRERVSFLQSAVVVQFLEVTRVQIIQNTEIMLKGSLK